MFSESDITLTEHAVGILMKEMVRRAIVLIRKNRFIFEIYSKASYDGKPDDLFTNADNSAQEIYIKLIQECFPGFGVLAEENNLNIPCTISGREIYFVVDPLDGTRAFTRRQSHGIGTMIALIDNGKIIASYVGDIMTQEIYGYRPEANSVYRISEYDFVEKLFVNEKLLLAKQYVLLQEDPRLYSPRIQQLTCKLAMTNIFKGCIFGGGSIGILMAQLWKGEIGAIILKPGNRTPWDIAPVTGISQKIGFAFLALDPVINKFSPCQIETKKFVYKEGREILIVHKSRLEEINHILI